MNVEIGAEAALFPEKENINGIAVAVCWPTSALAAGENQLFLFASRCHESGSPLSQQIQIQKEAYQTHNNPCIGLLLLTRTFMANSISLEKAAPNGEYNLLRAVMPDQVHPARQ